MIMGGILLLMPSVVFGDGPARPIRPEEIVFYEKLQHVLLPSIMKVAPEGWIASEVFQLDIPEYVSDGQENYPIREAVRARWFDPQKKNEYDARIEEIGAQAAATWNVADPRQQELEEEQKKLLDEFGVALQNNNAEDIQRIQKQLDVVQWELSSLLDAKAKVLNDELRKAQPRDASLDVRIELNSFYESLYTDQEDAPAFIREPPIAGAQVVRIGNGRYFNDTWEEGTTVATLGNWKVTQDGSSIIMESTPDPKIPYTFVQTVMVRVKAEKDRARKYLESLDWQVLQGLMNQP
jgi:hypothetical protein